MTDTETKTYEDATSFRYVKPEPNGNKANTVLARSEGCNIMVQYLDKGGENNLHAHPHTDEIWYVLSGRIRFYTTGDELIGEYGQNEGVVIPKGYPYWFEATEDAGGQAEVIRFGAPGPGARVDGSTRDRVNLAPLKPNQERNLA